MNSTMKGLGQMFAKRKSELPEVNFDIPTINVSRPLGEKARAIVEAGVTEFAAMKEERDNADNERLKALELVNQATASIRGLQSEIADLKARCTGYQVERDGAVAKFAKLQGLFASMMAQMHAFEIPEEVLSISKLPALDIETGIRQALNGDKSDGKRSAGNARPNLDNVQSVDNNKKG